MEAVSLINKWPVSGGEQEVLGRILAESEEGCKRRRKNLTLLNWLVCSHDFGEDALVPFFPSAQYINFQKSNIFVIRNSRYN